MRKRLLPYVLLLPSIIVLLIIIVYPSIEAFITSFTKYNLTDPAAGRSFVGLRNYIKMVMDYRFVGGLVRSLIFVFSSVSISFVVGFWLASLLNRAKKGQAIFRSLFLIPMVIASAVTGVIFKFMLNYDLGIINHFLRWIGFQGVDFLGNPSVALGAVISVDIWQWTPFVILVILAGLESLPPEPFEAAMLDGASSWDMLRFITAPLLKRFMIFVVIIRAMDAFREFDKIYLMTEGGPGFTSETLSVYISTVGFTWFDMGYSSALSFFALYFSLLIAFLTIRYTGIVGGK